MERIRSTTEEIAGTNIRNGRVDVGKERRIGLYELEQSIRRVQARLTVSVPLAA